MRELEYDPYMVIRVRSFPEYFFESGIIDTVSTDDEMPQISVAIWISSE